MQAAESPSIAVYLASRWAVKEAAYKAFGQGRLQFPEMELQSFPHHKPQLIFHGILGDMLANAGVSVDPRHTLVSLSHDGAMASAVVLLVPGSAASAGPDARIG